MKLLIDGQLISPLQYTGADDTQLDITITDAEENKIVQTEFELSDDAYYLIEELFIDNPAGKNAFVPVKIFEDKCCDTDILIFEGLLRGDMINWCYGECTARVQFIEHTAETKALDCIKSTLVDDNWNGFQSLIHPRVVYCNEMRPNELQHLVMILGIIANVILVLLTPLIAVVSLIIQGLQAIEDAFGSIGININIAPEFAEDTNLMTLWNDMVTSLNQRIIGCGRKHPSPYVRDYITNVCNKCGLNFSSTIYNNSNSEYYNALYFSAPIEKGTRDDDILYIEKNFPNKTLDLFLNDLNLVHNGRWDIIGDTLYFERKDYFNSGNVFVNWDVLNAANRIVNSDLCLNWREEERPAYISFDYTPDPVDGVGNEAADRYNDKVEWNLPFSEIQSGHVDIQLPFGTPRFRDDGIDEDILAIYSNIPFGLGAQIQAFQSTLILEKGTAFQPKLLIRDEATALDSTRIKRYVIYNELVDPPVLVEIVNHNYNFPYMFNEVNSVPAPGDPVAYPTDHPQSGLYPRFYSIDNPRLIIDQGKSFTFTMYYDCASLQDSLTARFVQLPHGIGRITKMQVSLRDKTITVSGEV